MRMGSNILIGAAVGAVVFQIFGYIRASRMEAMPLARRIEPEPEPEEKENREEDLNGEDVVNGEQEEEQEPELEGEE